MWYVLCFITFYSSSQPMIAQPADDKSTMRRILHRRVAMLDETEKSLAAQKVIELFFTMFSSLSPCTVSCYWPTSKELDIRPLLSTLHTQGWRCTLPVVVGRDQPLEFRVWEPGLVLHADAVKMLAPLPTQLRCHPTVLCIPCIGCDRQGFRLGRGGGYYDRTLKKLRKTGSILAIGIGYAVQVVDRLPCSSHDQRLDAFLSERFVLRFSSFSSVLLPFMVFLLTA